MRLIGICIAGAGMLGGCAAPKAEAPKPPRLMEYEDFMAFESSPGVLFAGQPSPAALESFYESGGRTVINLRTQGELDFVPYYDPAGDPRGFDYTHVECSGSTMGPAEYAVFEEAFSRAEGPVLVHCASGGRARMMWAAYEQEGLGLSREEVLANAAARGQDSEKAQASINAMLDRMEGDSEIMELEAAP